MLVFFCSEEGGQFVCLFVGMGFVEGDVVSDVGFVGLWVLWIDMYFVEYQ